MMPAHIREMAILHISACGSRGSRRKGTDQVNLVVAEVPVVKFPTVRSSIVLHSFGGRGFRQRLFFAAAIGSI